MTNHRDSQFPAGMATLAALLLSGCANTIQVTYLSDPPGAALYQGGQRIGYTPYSRQYPLTDDDAMQGSKYVEGVRVVWASGAAAEVRKLDVDLKAGRSNSFMFVRPEVGGRDTDLRIAAEMRTVRSKGIQDAVQQNAALFQVQTGLRPDVNAVRPDVMNAIDQQTAASIDGKTAAAQDAAFRQQGDATRANCVSTVSGNTVNTVCN